MPTVTALTFQKRDPSRCNISLDGGFAFALPALEVSRLGLKVGSELSTQEVDQLTGQAQSERAYQVAVRFLEIRMRSRFEIEQHLRRKDFGAADITTAVERLEQSGLLNDLEFAQRWVNDRLAFKPRSRPQLQAELAAKGIARETVQAALSEVGPEEQQTALNQLVAKKRRQRYDDERLTAYLARQGYGYSEIKRALERQPNET